MVPVAPEVPDLRQSCRRAGRPEARSETPRGEPRVGTIETFDHTADVGLRIRAAGLDDLFRTAAEGLFDYIVTNRSEVRAGEVETVAVAAEAPADLLVAWLNELIFRSETR